MLNPIPHVPYENKEVVPEDLIRAKPLNFELYYADKDNKPEIYNTIYLEDGNKPVNLYFEVFNQSSASVTLRKPTGNPPVASKTNYHFVLRFEKELSLDPAKISIETTDGDWDIRYDSTTEEHFFVIYFLQKTKRVLKPKNPGNNSHRVVFTLEKFTVRKQTLKSSNLELQYGPPLVAKGEGDDYDLEEFSDLVVYGKSIFITNHPDKKVFPLQYRFIGPNTILNDGTNPNSLKLQIVNRPPNNARPNLLLDKTNSKFIITVESGTTAKDLTSSENAAKIGVTFTSNPNTNNSQWQIDKAQNEVKWTIKLKDQNPPLPQYEFKVNEVIELDITNLVTNSASGVSYLYIAYQNIPGYPDGELLVPIEKTPLLYRGSNVGIGTASPQAKLEVKGGNAIFSDNLGIGTASPQAKLEVKGGNAIFSDNLGIGTTSPQAKLEVKGNIRLSGNIEGGADRTLRIYPNTSAANSRAWIEMWGNESGRVGELALSGTYIDFRYNSTTSGGVTSGGTTIGMRLTSGGQLGIGTTNLSTNAKLQVNGGDIKLGSDDRGIEFYDGAKIYKKSGSGLKIKPHDDNNGIEFTTADGTKSVMKIQNGNVGIGISTQPFAKLDVNGDILLSGHIKGGADRTLGIYPNINWWYSRAWIEMWGNENPARVGELGLGGTYIDFRYGSTNNDAGTVGMKLTKNGNLVIGQSATSKGKVHIEGGGNSISIGKYAFVSLTPKNAFASGVYEQTTAYSLYATDRIAASEFNAFSDARIKEIQGRSDTSIDLQTLLQIEITDYFHKDKIAKGDRQQKKVIGQQIAAVFPQAVKTHTEVVPDIFKLASITKGWVSLPAHGLQVGERVQLLLESSEPKIYTIEAVTPDSFQVPLDSEGDVFVYGREVDDFHVVDYDALSMLHISATQELWNIINGLKIDVKQIKAQLNGSHHSVVALANSI